MRSADAKLTGHLEHLRRRIAGAPVIAFRIRLRGNLLLLALELRSVPLCLLRCRPPVRLVGVDADSVNRPIDADPALPFQKKCGDDTFLVVEKWDSMDALKAHAAAPHMAAYGAKTKEMIASRVIHILSPT